MADNGAIPHSTNTVKVRMFDTTTNMVVNAVSFVEPVREGHEGLSLSTVGFLIEHEGTGKKVVFDLGAKKDFWNYAPKTRAIIPRICRGLKVDQNASEILRGAGIDLSSITSVIWSHSHWDHCGDMNTFPPTTELVVGPNWMNTFLPGYPEDPEGRQLSEWFEDRPLREISFLAGHKIGDFQAFDFFGDGSFYLLDSPGHGVAHICGLARTTPDTFIFMGGDICHFPGCFRPSPAHPLPHPIDLDVPKDSPIYGIAHGERSAYVDPERTAKDVAKLAALDADPNIFICLAHDRSLPKSLPTLNKEPSVYLSDWQAKGLKEKCMWDFLDELPRNGQPGRPSLVDGVWKEGIVVANL